MITKQRKRILDLIMQSDVHLSAEMVHDILKNDIDPIGVATVYRALNLLYEAGYINRIHHPQYGYVYDKNVNEHYHFHCTKCHNILDVDLPYGEGINEEIKRHINGDVCSHSLMFEGICEDCKKNTES
ncbi:Fur family transcriptional regulator [Erysipelothrix larvae]|nr:transcriptional repressor [Erysipelothrix larvae]